MQRLSKLEHNVIAAKYHHYAGKYHYAGIMPDAVNMALYQKLCRRKSSNLVPSLGKEHRLPERL